MVVCDEALDVVCALVVVDGAAPDPPDPEEDAGDEVAVDVETVDGTAGGRYGCPRHASTEA